MTTKHHRDCTRICRDAGLSVLGLELGGKHLRVRCQEGVVIMPSSPSDRRWQRKALAFARRLQVDL